MLKTNKYKIKVINFIYVVSHLYNFIFFYIASVFINNYAFGL